jgi:hypothetical protein
MSGGVKVSCEPSQPRMTQRPQALWLCGSVGSLGMTTAGFFLQLAPVPASGYGVPGAPPGPQMISEGPGPRIHCEDGEDECERPLNRHNRMETDAAGQGSESFGGQRARALLVYSTWYSHLTSSPFAYPLVDREFSATKPPGRPVPCAMCLVSGLTELVLSRACTAQDLVISSIVLRL